jgi:N-dimethylarginine dimethylaminohydrolase
MWLKYECLVFSQVLRGLVKEVHEIPVNEKHPDGVFVEDPVIVCGDTAFLPILGK